jgi:pyruvate/2-oxoacid:ferredoxin oxidoreductase alpha subunit
MTERRFGKLKLLEDGDYEAERTSASIVVMPWGASKGSVREAFNQLIDAGVDLGWYYSMFISPLPAAMLEELQSKDLVIVPELNYQGQMAGILRAQGVKAEAITQYTGLPFGPTDLAGRIKQLLAERIGAVNA